jgi:hypothetical protein
LLPVVSLGYLCLAGKLPVLQNRVMQWASWQARIKWRHFPLFLAFENAINITEAKTTNETVTEKQFMTTFFKIIW